MTWQQTLLIAVVPAIVTAAALLVQSEVAARREVRRRKDEAEAAARAELKSAHLELLHALSALWQGTLLARLAVRVYHGTGSPVIPRSIRPDAPDMTRCDQAFDGVRVVGDDAQVNAAGRAVMAFAEMVSALSRTPSSPEPHRNGQPLSAELIAVEDAANVARVEYAMVVRAAIGRG